MAQSSIFSNSDFSALGRILQYIRKFLILRIVNWIEITNTTITVNKFPVNTTKTVYKCPVNTTIRVYKFAVNTIITVYTFPVNTAIRV